ncbi:hypothetical protein FYK55_23440 [Roseiconus nitratireducens]|uniref:Chaperone NapD n=1 Tax=Roseiconus nitratireducens TaxID=2605748 RepID=A0A5M6CWZ7_9BACT|nr:hypothetical protein [Roseiconus nitratireducens]KAA5539754.1 hypothetical protein FYK55_23440 [Roseiconus nitratireducens]
MPISGLVITFDSAVHDQPEAIEFLRHVSEIEMGQAAGNKLAIVIESKSKRRDQEIWNAIRALTGVIDLAVALVAFDEDNELENNNPIRNQT